MTAVASSKEQYQRGLLAWLAINCGERGNLGKTAVQKLVYALTNMLNVPTGYKFSIYTYGPFCRDLSADLDTADFLRVVNVGYFPQDNRYVVAEGENSKSAIMAAEDFLVAHKSSLDWISSHLGSQTARSLELYTTLHYIKFNENIDDDDEAIKKLISLKPKFDREEVSACLKRVKTDVAELYI